MSVRGNFPWDFGNLSSGYATPAAHDRNGLQDFAETAAAAP